MTALLVAVGGAAGAALRYWLATTLDDVWPWGTLVVNTAGSLMLGALVGAGVDGDVIALLGTGFCGGLTTCSAFAVQTVDQRHRVYPALTVLLSVAGASLGFVVAQA